MHRPLAHQPRAGLGLMLHGRGLIEALGVGHGNVSEGGRARHQRPAAEKGAGRSPEQCQRSRCLAREGRGDGRAQAHHRRGQPRSRGCAHHLSGRPGEKPGAAVREHQGPSRPQGALQHDRLQPVAVLPDDRRGAGRSSAQGGAAAAEEDRTQDGAGRGPGRAARSRNQNIVDGDEIDIRSSRRSGCGRSTAACISAPATPSSPRTPRPAASTSAPTG